MTRFDLGVKWVMVNQDSLSEQITMGHSTQCYIHSFKAIIPLVPEKNNFDYLPYMVMATILVYDWDQLNISLLPTHKSFI